jgi:uncharacterized membrane protein
VLAPPALRGRSATSRQRLEVADSVTAVFGSRRFIIIRTGIVAADMLTALARDP